MTSFLALPNNNSWGPEVVEEDTPFTICPTHPMEEKCGGVASLNEEGKGSFTLEYAVKAPKPKKSWNFKKRRYNDKKPQGNYSKELEAQKRMQQHRSAKMKKNRNKIRKMNYWKRPILRNTASSIEVKPSWITRFQIPFTDLQKAEAKNVSFQVLSEAGTLNEYNPKFDKITVKKSVLIPPTKRKLYIKTTSNDQILKKYSKDISKNLRIFSTAKILSLLMNSTRSIYSWDLIITKKGNQITIDTRAKTRVDMYAQSETSRDPPHPDDKIVFNNVKNLALEATKMNHFFCQQVLTSEKKDLENPHPYKGTKENAGGTAYRYLRYDIPDENMQFFIRAELQGYLMKGNEMKYLSIKSINEYRESRDMDFREDLQYSAGKVLISYIKDNSCRMARYTTQALLARADLLKLGYITRKDFKNPRVHELLNVEEYSVKNFAQQIGVNQGNMWGILKEICSRIALQEDGKYALVKPPAKSIVQLYQISSKTSGLLIFRNLGNKFQFLLVRKDNDFTCPNGLIKENDKKNSALAQLDRLHLSKDDVSFGNLKEPFSYTEEFDDKDTKEVTNITIFACCLKDANAKIDIESNYTEVKWFNFEPPHNIEKLFIDPLLNSLEVYLKENNTTLEQMFA